MRAFSVRVSAARVCAPSFIGFENVAGKTLDGDEAKLVPENPL
jgi:hypothetical protein